MKIAKIKKIIESDEENGSDGSSKMSSTAVIKTSKECDAGIKCEFCFDSYTGDESDHFCGN